MLESNHQSHSTGWLFFVKVAFALSVLTMAAGIAFMPGELVVRGYFAISALFMVSTTITLSKTLRDDHENSRLINKISEAKTNKIIKEYSE